MSQCSLFQNKPRLVRIDFMQTDSVTEGLKCLCMTFPWCVNEKKPLVPNLIKKKNCQKNYGASLRHKVFNYSIQHSRLKYDWPWLKRIYVQWKRRPKRLTAPFLESLPKVDGNFTCKIAGKRSKGTAIQGKIEFVKLPWHFWPLTSFGKLHALRSWQSQQQAMLRKSPYFSVEAGPRFSESTSACRQVKEQTKRLCSNLLRCICRSSHQGVLTCNALADSKHILSQQNQETMNWIHCINHQVASHLSRLLSATEHWASLWTWSSLRGWIQDGHGKSYLHEQLPGCCFLHTERLMTLKGIRNHPRSTLETNPVVAWIKIGQVKFSPSCRLLPPSVFFSFDTSENASFQFANPTPALDNPSSSSSASPKLYLLYRWIAGRQYVCNVCKLQCCLHSRSIGPNS